MITKDIFEVAIFLVDNRQIESFTSMAYMNKCIPFIMIKGNYVKNYVLENDVPMNVDTITMILTLNYENNNFKC